MTHTGDEVSQLQAENASLREQLAKATRRATRAIARHQQHALSMETIRQKNEELDRLTSELERSNQALRASSAENEGLIAQLRALVEQLSTPILEVGPQVLALPIIGNLDRDRAASITDRTLSELARLQARWVILDVTGTSTVNLHTLRHLLSLARATRLLGARCVLCGVQPQVARAMIELDVELGEITSVRNLHEALSLTR